MIFAQRVHVRVSVLYDGETYSRDVTARDKRCMGGGCFRSRSRSRSCCNQLLIHSAPARLARCRPAGSLKFQRSLPACVYIQHKEHISQPSRIVSCLSLSHSRKPKAWKKRPMMPVLVLVFSFILPTPAAFRRIAPATATPDTHTCVRWHSDCYYERDGDFFN